MSANPTLIAAALAIGLTFHLASTVQAQEGPSGQQPPAEQQAPSDPTPAKKPDCVSSKTGFKTSGKAASFVIELQNACEMRLKCTVDAYVVGARGPAAGHATLILAPKLKGATASKSYALKVKSAGGMAIVSHTCKAI